MVDTYKEKVTVTPVIQSHRKRVYLYNVLQSDTGTVNEPPTWYNSSYYRTTERNVKKNKGKWPPKLKSLSSSIQLVPLGKGHKVQVYDKALKKLVWIRKPVLVPRIVRKNAVLDPKLASQILVNDLQRFIHQTTGYGVVEGSHHSRGYEGQIPPVNDGITVVYDGSSEFMYNDSGFSFTPKPAVQANSLENRYATEVAQVSNQSIRKLYSYIKNQPADLGTDFAEGMQTIRMFANISERLVELFVSIKKLKLNKIESEISKSVDDIVRSRLVKERSALLNKAVKDFLPTDKKKLANDFLAYRYGISPLINDIAGLQKEISDNLAGVLRYKATGRAMMLIESDNKTVEIQVKHYALYSVSDHIMDMLSRLGLTNPVNVVWELVPFSFVVDWLLPIGPYLNMLTTLDHLTVKSVHRTVTIREIITHETPSAGNNEPPQHWFVGSGGYAWQVSNFSLTRTVLSSFPLIPVPSFKSPFSVGHVANFIALLTQAISKR